MRKYVKIACTELTEAATEEVCLQIERFCFHFLGKIYCRSLTYTRTHKLHLYFITQKMAFGFHHKNYVGMSTKLHHLIMRPVR